MNSLANKLSIENREGTLENIEKDEPIHYDVVINGLMQCGAVRGKSLRGC